MIENSDSGESIRRYRRLAKTVVEKFFGKEANRLIYKPSGLTNQVFVVNHVEGQFVVRISSEPEKINAFKKEFWATAQARIAGIPVPDVLLVGNELISEPHMIARRVSGIEASHHSKRRDIVHEMGAYSAVINSIKTTGFGDGFDWTGNTEAIRVEWKDYFDNEWRAEERLEFINKYRILSDHNFERLRDAVTEMRKMSVTPSLNHGDLRLKNLIVDEGGDITAVIDWEHCISTISPHWDLSIALHDLSIDDKHAFIKGYGLSNQQVEEMAPFTKAFNIMNYTDAIEEAVKLDDESRLNEFRLRLGGAFDLYSLP